MLNTDLICFLTLSIFKKAVAYTRDSFLERSVGLQVFAVLKDGQWYEKGKMGWWACVTNEKDSSSWETELNKLLDETPKGTLLSLYDCHI
jgi:hypothetical protein